jgi:prevent-host-death family protein
MSTHTLDISEARKQFNKLDDLLRDDHVIKITRHGKGAFAVVDIDYLQTMIETIDILSDPDTSKALQEGLEDIKKGRLHDHDDVKRELW